MRRDDFDDLYRDMDAGDYDDGFSNDPRDRYHDSDLYDDYHGEYDIDDRQEPDPFPRPRRRYSKQQIEEMKRKRKKNLFFRRAGIILAVFLVLFLIVVLIIKAVQAIIKPDESKATPDELIATEAPDPYPYARVFNKPKVADDNKTEGHISSENSGVYIYNNMALETFSGDDASAQSYAEAISEFKNKAPELTVYNMVVPTHIEYAVPQRLIDSGSVETGSQAAFLSKIFESYTADVVPVNCYNKLSDHAADYIFFNTDTQMTALGGYYAYTAFTEQTNQRTLDLTVCAEHKITGYEGSLLYTDSSLSSHLDTVHYWTFPYETHADRTESNGEEPYEISIFYEAEESGPYAYGVFFWGDCPLFVEYNEDIESDKKIAVVKENSSNSFVSYLTADYKEVHIIDYRYFSGSIKSYCQKNGIGEVLFVNSASSADSSDALKSLREIF